jgi:hypothetical protein
MKNTKRIFCLLLCAALCMGLLLTACNDTEAPSADATYKVTVVDGLGNAYTEKVIVKLMQGGKQVTMGPINNQGVYEKVLPRGEYTVEVASTNTELDCYFIETKLTAEVTEAQVVMAFAPTEFNSISAPGGDVDAGLVSTGSSYHELISGQRVYALFTPTEAGIYEFSVSNDDAVIGYYGSPYFIQSSNVAENVNGNTFTISVEAGMISTGSTGTSVFVIGLDAKDGKESCILNIKRLGDPAWSINSEPWNAYVPKTPVEKFTLESGVKLVPFNVAASTDAYKLVLNEQDGVYHLGTADGPKVYVQLWENVYGISMKEMVGEIVYDADNVLISTGTAPFRYQYDNGKDDFFKEDYTDYMRQAVTAADKATGVYPMTEDMFYLLPLGIDNKGWCREGTINYLFNSTEVNPEIAWMFMLCHADGKIPEANPDDDKPQQNPDDNKPTGPVVDNKDAPIEIGSTLNFEADVKANHLVYFDLFRVNDTTLTIKSKDAYVIYNGITYEAKNGVVTVPNLYPQYTNMPVSIQIGNKGAKDAVFAVTLSYPVGHRENPVELQMKSFTVDVKKNNEQGVYYHYAPSKAGKLTISMDKVTSASGAVEADISVTITTIVDGLPIPHQFKLSEIEGNTLTVDVNAGDDVVITVGVMPNSQNRYLAATIDVTASFA